MHLFCGLIDSEGVGGIHGLEEENEDIRLVKMTFTDAWQRLEKGDINNAATIMALQWLKLNHQHLFSTDSYK